MSQVKRVLVVDDDSEVRRTISASLASSGFEPTDVGDGDQAMTHLSAQAFDLAICDLFMPGKDGLETILAMRKSQPQMPIILITGGGRHFSPGAGALEDLLQSAEFFGVTHVLMKPFRPSQLISLVKTVLSSDQQ